MSPKPKHDRWYPSVSNSVWVENFAVALRAYPDVRLTNEAIDFLKWIVVRPKDLVRSTKDGYRLKDGVVGQKLVRGGHKLFLLHAEIFGAVTVISPHNDRLVDTWMSPFQASSQSDPVLPPRAQITDDHGAPAPELVVRVGSAADLRRILKHTARHLEDADISRTYSLSESLAIEGQRAPGMSVMTRYTTDDGRFYMTLTAVAGNNRAHRRGQLLGLTAEEQVLGVPTSKLHGFEDDGKIVASVPQWVGPLYDQLEVDSDEKSLNGLLVGQVTEEIVVGVQDLGNLVGVLHRDNVAEHIQSVLEYSDAPRYDALGRQLLDAYLEEGMLTAAQAAILKADALPDPGADPVEVGLTDAWDPAVPARMTELRDWRNRKLIWAIYPDSAERRKIVRRVLAEPATSGLGKRNEQERSRLLNVMQSKGFPKGWNARAGDIFGVTEAKKGVTVTDTPLAEMLEQAAPGKFPAELAARLAPFMCAAELIVSDRGSLSNEDVKDPSVPTARRAPGNALQAICRDKHRGKQFAQEVVEAVAEQRPPRRVSADGVVQEGTTAARDWINLDAFPKVRRDAGPPQAETEEPEAEEQDIGVQFASTVISIADEISNAEVALEEIHKDLGVLRLLNGDDSTLTLEVDTYQDLGTRLSVGIRKRAAEAATDLSDLAEEPA